MSHWCVLGSTGSPKPAFKRTSWLTNHTSSMDMKASITIPPFPSHGYNLLRAICSVPSAPANLSFCRSPGNL